MSPQTNLATLPPRAIQTAEWARLAERAYAENTRRAWGYDWRSFTQWCEAQGVQPLPATPSTVAGYLQSKEAGKAAATIRRRAATIARAHSAAGLENPCRGELVRLTLRAIARERAQRQRQAPGLTHEHVERIRETSSGARADEKLRDLRDLALVLVGRDLLARVSELVSVRLDAIEWDEDGTAVVRLLRRKTDDEARDLLLGVEAVDALRAWLAAAGIAAGPVFRGIDRAGTVSSSALSVRAVGKLLQAARKRAGIKPRFSAHSLRVGMAQDMAAENIDSGTIARSGGWRSLSMVLRYTERQELKRGGVAQYHARKSRT